MFRYRTVKLRVRSSARQHHWCRRSTIAVHPGRLTTAAEELAPFKQALDGPSLRSKRGVEDFGRIDNTYSGASKHRGAPTSPPWAAETLEALDTRLRQHQSNSTVPARYRGCGTLRAGTFYRSPHEVSGRLGRQPEPTIPQGTHSPGNSLPAVAPSEYTAGGSRRFARTGTGDRDTGLQIVQFGGALRHARRVTPCESRGSINVFASTGR